MATQYLVLFAASALAIAWLVASALDMLGGEAPARARSEPAEPDPAPLRPGVARRPASRRPTAPAEPDPAPFSGRAWVVDGGSILVNRKRVRMFGIDAPGISQRGGGKARSHLVRIASGKTVRVEPRVVDEYGYIVARVWHGDVDLSDLMVRDGFARATAEPDAHYAPAEFDARRQRRGLWRRDPVGGIGDPTARRRTNSKRDQDDPDPDRGDSRPPDPAGPDAARTPKRQNALTRRERT